MISKTELKKICHENKVNLNIEEFTKIVDVNEDNMVNYSEFSMATFDF